MTKQWWIDLAQIAIDILNDDGLKYGGKTYIQMLRERAEP